VSGLTRCFLTTLTPAKRAPPHNSLIMPPAPLETFPTALLTTNCPEYESRWQSVSVSAIRSLVAATPSLRQEVPERRLPKRRPHSELRRPDSQTLAAAGAPRARAAVDGPCRCIARRRLSRSCTPGARRPTRPSRSESTACAWPASARSAHTERPRSAGRPQSQRAVSGSTDRVRIEFRYRVRLEFG
jgi:hypothetical protein